PIRPEPRRHASPAHLDDPTDGIAVGTRRVDPLLQVVSHDRAGNLDADLPDERLRDRTTRDDRRGVPRTGPLERVSRIGELVLHDAREIGMAWPRERHRLLALSGGVALRRPGAHPPLPVGMVTVANEEGERRPEGAAVPEPGQHLDRVRLDLLPRASAVAL